MELKLVLEGGNGGAHCATTGSCPKRPMGTRGRVDTSPVAQGCPRGLKLRVQYESHTPTYNVQRTTYNVPQYPAVGIKLSVEHGGVSIVPEAATNIPVEGGDKCIS